MAEEPQEPRSRVPQALRGNPSGKQFPPLPLRIGGESCGKLRDCESGDTLIVCHSAITRMVPGMALSGGKLLTSLEEHYLLLLNIKINPPLNQQSWGTHEGHTEGLALLCSRGISLPAFSISITETEKKRLKFQFVSI